MNQMKKDNRPRQLTQRIYRADLLVNELLKSREQSREAREYNAGMSAYANIIEDIARHGALAEKIEAEIALQERDFDNARQAGNPRLERF